MRPYPRTWAEIDLAAITHNLAALRESYPPATQIALVAKADAYGHGLVPIARHASRNGADWIAVATVQEAISLRDAGVSIPIMAMSPLLQVEADQAVFYDVDVFIEDTALLPALSQAAKTYGRPARIHLKVDTGMHRFGCTPEAVLELATAAAQTQGISTIGLVQHFINATDTERSEAQLARFQIALDALRSHNLLPGLIHGANSFGGILYNQPDQNLVRAGLLAYGVDPYNTLGGKARPALTWFARVTAIRDVPAGDTVGYNATYTATRDVRIATLGVGYGDGYARHLSNKGMVRFGEHDAPVVGLVCMDQTMVDVTDIPGVQVGDIATLIGPGIGAPRLAAAQGTNSHEVLTRLMTRVPRRYLNRT